MSARGMTSTASPAIAAMTRYAESTGAITDPGLKELYRITTDLYAELNAAQAELAKTQKLAKSRAEAIDASKHLFNHVQQVLGGWAECKGCEAANNQCDGSLACGEAKNWSRLVDAAWRKS